MNDQNQNIQPDYNFILNQPGSKPPEESKKSRKKLLLIVGIGAGLLIILLGFLLLAKGKTNQPTVSNGSSNASTTSTPVNQILDAVKQQEYATAAGYLPGGQINQDQAVQALQKTFQGIDLTSCKITYDQAASGAQSSDLVCRSSDNKYGIDLHFLLGQQDNGVTILQYNLQVTN